MPAIYFQFEDDFVEENLRCIPMIVRFKLDTVLIKLKLSEWSKFSPKERLALAEMPCQKEEEREEYSRFLREKIETYTGEQASVLPQEKLDLRWKKGQIIPEIIKESALEKGYVVSLKQWQHLSDLQRFAILKLCTSEHESHNFGIALEEFIEKIV